MKARINPSWKLDYKTKKAITEFTNEQLDKERSDIAKRSIYLVLLAMWQVGLSPKTMKKVQNMLPVVTQKYEEYKTDKLGDMWAKVTLQDAGVNVDITNEQF